MERATVFSAGGSVEFPAGQRAANRNRSGCHKYRLPIVVQDVPATVWVEIYGAADTLLRGWVPSAPAASASQPARRRAATGPASARARGGFGGAVSDGDPSGWNRRQCAPAASASASRPARRRVATGPAPPSRRSPPRPPPRRRSRRRPRWNSNTCLPRTSASSSAACSVSFFSPPSTIVGMSGKVATTHVPHNVTENGVF